jgi:serine/threonine-protein kinase
MTGEATIGTYRVLKKIGEGGMGTVYIGEHVLLGRKAAIKVLLPSLSSNQEIVARFFNEARAVTLIADPGIVQIFDFGYHTDGSAFIIMELLEGEPMDKRLERIGRFGLSDGLRLMRLICTSLGAAHGKGIVHRDLKPENIFLVGDPAVPGGERAKILDFGIAKLSVNEPGKLKTRTGMLMGTPVYMSPEQCRGTSDIDHRSDIYTIGCVMFTMLTGRPPFDGEGAGELIAAHLREPPPLACARVPELPGIIDQILQQCMQKSPMARFQSMAELIAAIGFAEQTLSLPSSFIGASSSGAFPAPAPGWANASPPIRTTLSGASGQTDQSGQTMSVRRRHQRTWIAGLVVGAVAIGGGAAFVAVRGGDGSPRVSPSTAASSMGDGRTVVTAVPDAGISDAPPLAQTPVTQTPAAQTPAAQTPAAQAPLTQAPGAQAPGAQAPAAELPVTQLPAANLSVPQSPAAKPPVAKPPVAKPPVAQAIDAAAPPSSPRPPKTVGKSASQPSRGGDHASSSGSATPSKDDRSD